MQSLRREMQPGLEESEKDSQSKWGANRTPKHGQTLLSRRQRGALDQETEAPKGQLWNLPPWPPASDAPGHHGSYKQQVSALCISPTSAWQRLCPLKAQAAAVRSAPRAGPGKAGSTQRARGLRGAGCSSQRRSSRTHVGCVVSGTDGSSSGPFHSVIWGTVPGYMVPKPRLFLEIL